VQIYHHLQLWKIRLFATCMSTFRSQSHIRLRAFTGMAHASSKGENGARTLTHIVIYSLLVVAILCHSRGHHKRTSLGSPTNRFVVITDNPFLMSKIPARRKAELLRSVRMNLDSPYVSSLHLLNMAPNDTLYPSEKLHVYDLGWRSSFLDAIRYANAVLPSDTLFAVANADIVFAHDSVRFLTRINDSDVVAALSRHDVDEDGGATIHEDPSQSQDAWFMRTPFPEDPRFDFPLGALGADNKLAYLFESLNKTLINWCDDVVIWHIHSSQHRRAKVRLPRPYAMVPNTGVDLSMIPIMWREQNIDIDPSGLWGLFGTSVQAITMDLPRLDGAPTTTSNIISRQRQPEWSAAAVHRMRSLAKRRLRNTADALVQKRPASARQVYFLDVSWSWLARNESNDSWLVRSLHDWRPSVTRSQIFGLVPRDLVPAVCRGAREWREFALGTIDRHGALQGELDCSQVPET